MDWTLDMDNLDRQVFIKLLIVRKNFMHANVVASDLSEIRKTLKNIPNKVYCNAAPDIKSFEQVALNITTYLTLNETMILNSQNTDRQKMLKCLTKINIQQYTAYHLLEACELAKVSLDDYMNAVTKVVCHNQNPDDVQKMYDVNTARFVLGQLTEEEIKEMNLSDSAIEHMKIRMYSKEFIENDAVFHDVMSSNFRYIQKINFLIKTLEPNTVETGWLPGRTCTIQ